MTATEASGEHRRIALGRIVGVHGVQGWIKLESHTQPRSGIFRYTPWVLRHRGAEREIVVSQGREQGRGLVAELAGIATREDAQALIGAEILIPRSALPKPKPGEYYWVDLEGLRVIDTHGADFGRVAHLFATGANDVMSVRGEGDDGRERLIPFITPDVIKRVDFDAGLIEVDWDADF